MSKGAGAGTGAGTGGGRPVTRFTLHEASYRLPLCRLEVDGTTGNATPAAAASKNEARAAVEAIDAFWRTRLKPFEIVPSFYLDQRETAAATAEALLAGLRQRRLRTYILRGWRAGESFRVIFYDHMTYVWVSVSEPAEAADFREALAAFIQAHPGPHPSFFKGWVFSALFLLTLLSWLSEAALSLLQLTATAPRWIPPIETVSRVVGGIAALFVVIWLQVVPGGLHIEPSPTPAVPAPAPASAPPPPPPPPTRTGLARLKEVLFSRRPFLLFLLTLAWILGALANTLSTPPQYMIKTFFFALSSFVLLWVYTNLWPKP